MPMKPILHTPVKRLSPNAVFHEPASAVLALRCALSRSGHLAVKTQLCTHISVFWGRGV